MILLAQGDNERAGSVGFGLSFWPGFAVAEELKGLATELAAKHAKSAWAVAEAASDFVGGEGFDEKGAEGLVLALGG